MIQWRHLVPMDFDQNSERLKIIYRLHNHKMSVSGLNVLTIFLSPDNLDLLYQQRLMEMVGMRN